MSASRMDKYKSCHFSYFMQYGLKAEPRRAAGFQAPEYGTFVHYVLEHVLRACRERGGVKEVPEEELRTLAQAAVERYVSEELGGLEHETARFRYLFRRLLKSVYAWWTTWRRSCAPPSSSLFPSSWASARGRTYPRWS